LEQTKVKFPKIIKNKKTKVEVTIYGKSKGGERKKDGSVTQPYPFYRVCWRVAGQRRMQSFRTYSAAKKAAEDLVRDLGSGSQVTALTPGQASDARAALERLQGLYQATGRKVSLLVGISEYCEAIRKLTGHTLSAAVDGFLSTVATVKRMDLGQAVEEFIKGRAHKTKSENGKRPQLSASYAYIVAMWLREFAKTFPGTAVCDLSKELLNAYMASHSDVTARTRNGRRSVLGMFLKWCVRQDYLAAGHRLLEANGMIHEESEPEAIEFYTPAQLSDLLETASEQREYRHLLPVIALCGLAGLRLQEAVRLTWEDVFRVDGHVEISRTKSKTRARRLVAVCPALAQWLAPYRECSGPIWTNGLEKFHSDFGDLRTLLKIPARRNGLRHGFCTYHFALHSNENLTAALAGNSPAMIHAHYKGLATKAEAEKWFNVRPAKAAANIVPLPKQAGA
jgi:integrase